MILIVDYRQNESRLLLADNGSVRRFNEGPNTGFYQLQQVLDVLGDAKVEGVAVVLPDRDDKSNDNKMTWSAVRAAVTMGNSLAFAWGVPAVRLSPENEVGLAKAATKALDDADVNSRVSALYDGEPNITKPKAK